MDPVLTLLLILTRGVQAIAKTTAKSTTTKSTKSTKTTAPAAPKKPGPSTAPPPQNVDPPPLQPSAPPATSTTAQPMAKWGFMDMLTIVTESSVGGPTEIPTATSSANAKIAPVMNPSRGLQPVSTIPASDLPTPTTNSGMSPAVIAIISGFTVVIFVLVGGGVVLYRLFRRSAEKRSMEAVDGNGTKDEEKEVVYIPDARMYPTPHTRHQFHTLGRSLFTETITEEDESVLYVPGTVVVPGGSGIPDDPFDSKSLAMPVSVLGIDQTRKLNRLKQPQRVSGTSFRKNYGVWSGDVPVLPPPSLNGTSIFSYDVDEPRGKRKAAGDAASSVYMSVLARNAQQDYDNSS